VKQSATFHFSCEVVKQSENRESIHATRFEQSSKI